MNLLFSGMKLQVQFVLLTLMLMHAFSLSAGTTRIDSLINKLSVANEGERCAVHRELAFEFMGKDDVEALKHARLAVFFSKYETNPLMLVKIMRYKGFIMRRLNMLDSALIVLYEVRKNALARNYDREVFNIQLSIASSYLFKSRYNDALDWFFRTLALPIAKDDVQKIQSLHCNIGLTYYKMEDPKRAIKHYREALQHGPHVADSWITINTNLSLCYSELKDSINARYYLLRASECMDDISGANEMNVSFATAYFHKHTGNRRDAERFYTKCLKIAERELDDRIQIECLIGLSEIYADANRLGKCHSVLNAAVQIAGRSELMRERHEVYERLALYYAKVKNWEKASKYQKLYIKGIKEVSNIRYSALRDVELDFLASQQSDAMIQKNEIIETKDQKIWWQFVSLIVSISVVVLLSLYLVAVFRLSRHRKKNVVILERLVQDRTALLSAEITSLRIKRHVDIDIVNKKLRAGLHAIRNVRSLGKIVSTTSVNESVTMLDHELNEVERLLNDVLERRFVPDVDKIDDNMDL